MLPAVAATLLLTLMPSRRLALAAWILHLLAAVCIAVAALPWFLEIGLLMAVAGSLYHERRARLALTRPRSIVAIRASADGEWQVVRRDGSISRARLDDGAYVHPLLVVASFTTDDGPRERVVVVPDMTPADSMRELRVRLRCRSRC